MVAKLSAAVAVVMLVLEAMMETIQVIIRRQPEGPQREEVQKCKARRANSSLRARCMISTHQKPQLAVTSPPVHEDAAAFTRHG